jgi:hypothetical protein
VRVASETEVTSQVDALARDVAIVLGGKLIRRASNTVDCDNSVSDTSGEVRSVQGAYQITTADAHERADFETVRDHWRERSWTITEDWFNPDTGAGSVTSKAADGSLEFSLSGTGSPNVFALIVHSGCFREQRGPSASP